MWVIWGAARCFETLCEATSPDHSTLTSWYEKWTHDPQLTGLLLCHWAKQATILAAPWCLIAQAIWVTWRAARCLETLCGATSPDHLTLTVWYEDLAHDPQLTGPLLCHWAKLASVLAAPWCVWAQAMWVTLTAWSEDSLDSLLWGLNSWPTAYETLALPLNNNVGAFILFVFKNLIWEKLLNSKYHSKFRIYDKYPKTTTLSILLLPNAKRKNRQSDHSKSEENESISNIILIILIWVVLHDEQNSILFVNSQFGHIQD